MVLTVVPCTHQVMGTGFLLLPVGGMLESVGDKLCPVGDMLGADLDT